MAATLSIANVSNAVVESAEGIAPAAGGSESSSSCTFEPVLQPIIDLGDLEGLGDDEATSLRRFLADPKASKPLYGYRWEDGLVAPWVPADAVQLDGALHSLTPKPCDLIIDLGCGDGRVLTRAVECFCCKGHGVELDEALVIRAEEAAASLPESLRSRIDIVRGDLFDVSLWRRANDGPDTLARSENDHGDDCCRGRSCSPEVKGRTLFVLYLLPGALQRLAPLLEPELRAGAVVCTLRWSVPGWDGRETTRGDGWQIYV
eukprot:TRINITY_DN44574_c0_g1_i1.p1 TRINITY_DN44574_c0_g1~~TRINITY_DN44574_c0_g1_i1.p1  ORF type:complete len:261 (+),score=44.31 TRINITY_DN44574_c0_g1_i1:33-815(+)